MPHINYNKFKKAIGKQNANAITNYSAFTVFSIRVAGAALAYLLQVFIARIIGTHHYGVFVVVWTLLVILVMFSNLGLSNSVSRFLPQYTSQGKASLVRGILYGSRIAVFICASAIAGIGALGIWLLDDAIAQPYILPIAIALTCLPLYTLCSLQEGIARAYNWQFLSVAPEYIWRPTLIIIFMAIAVFLDFPRTAVTAVLCTIFAIWSITAIQTLLLHKKLKKQCPPAPRQYQFKLWLQVSLPILLVDGFFQLLTSADVIIAGFWVPSDQVAIYFAASRTVALLHFVYYAVRSATAMQISQLYYTKNSRKLSEYIGRAAQLTFWPTLILTAILLPCSPFLLSFFGEGYEKGFPVLLILTFGILARAAIGPVDSLLSLSGNQTLCAGIYALTFAVNVGLNISLAPSFGLIGIAIATSLAMILEAILLIRGSYLRLGILPFFIPLHKKTVIEV
ncbi:lipopolysaccharide biosynthesis protein [Flexibacterium corallicola]|uniref:lipopolysaccharide biosynthesis protein n=1 Tax=Flexibacterium corallicola TaxID=3037259 RepID=UPI00286EF066|nr:oligosaccharide flippase family protein [Pseudovibrio sp. M1P-2-3]